MSSVTSAVHFRTAPPRLARRPGRYIPELYRRLFRRFGPQHWWPAATPFEVMVGAILTQNAAWSNVEQAIANLKGARKLTPHALLRLPVRRLETLIQPSGFFRVKARRLRSFLSYFVVEYDGSVDRMRRRHLPRLREELLAVHGIGPETADSMLLYALGKPCFVVDAYTRRILSRHGLIRHPDDYEEVKALFERNLPGRVRLLNEYHALLVRLAKTHCRNKPLCSGCPLASLRRGRT